MNIRLPAVQSSHRPNDASWIWYSNIAIILQNLISTLLTMLKNTSLTWIFLPNAQIICNVQQRWGESDLYRDTPIRYFGYANEVGEAFRAWVPRPVVTLSYVIASGYVLADAFDKGHRVHKLNRGHDRRIRRAEVALTVFDVMIWQAFASVIIPGYSINRLCAFSRSIFTRYQKVPKPLALVSTTLIGLLAIPIIIKPIDAFVDTAMDASIRKYYTQSPPPILKLVEK